MIFVTVDTQGDINLGKLNPRSKLRRLHKDLTKNDYVIVCGDFGVIWENKKGKWEEKLLKYYEDCPWTTLFIDGNHENFTRLNNEFPVTEWNGGKVQKINDSIYHLMRGQVFELEGETIFTFGGGISYDKGRRTPYVSWWPEEIPNYKECEEAFKNLKKHNNEVDYFITHTCSHRIMDLFIYERCFHDIWEDPTFKMLDEIEKVAKYRKGWYFGHFHHDRRLS